MRTMHKKLLAILIIPFICSLFCVAAFPLSATAAKPSIPAGCPDSGKAGPAKPGVCGSIPAGCPGSSHQGKPKPASECPYAAPADNDNGNNNNGNNNGNANGNNANNANGNANGNNNNGNANNNDDKCQGSECTNTPTGQGKNCDDKHCDLVALYVNPTINLLSIVVGLVVAASLIMGGIQYTASSGDPQKTGAAKSRIQNTLLAFLAYAFLYAFLNFLIPGGLFG